MYKYVLLIQIFLLLILAQEELDLRIYQGQVQIYRNNIFLNVCDDDQNQGTLSEYSLIVLCKQLGYNISNFNQITVQQSQICNNGSGFGLDDLNCNSSSYRHVNSCDINLNSHNCGNECIDLDCGTSKFCSGGLYYKQSTQQCVQCDNTICATCQHLDTQCILVCNSTCKTCTSNSYCDSCENGQYFSGQTGFQICVNQCDNTKCATCQHLDTQCILECNSTCKTCTSNSYCDSCDNGQYFSGQTGFYVCVNQCDNTICATCQNLDTQCILKCNSNCKTCTTNSYCDSCENGQYFSGQSGFQVCVNQCDNTKCATCQNIDTQCMLNCNSTCKTCISNSFCDSCEIGYYLFGPDNQKTCLQCDNTKCATCQNLDTQCILNCNSTCKTCITNSYCDSCESGFFLFGPDNQKTCLQCDNTKCATCINQDSQCVINCNSTCQTCNIDSFCSDCEDGFYLFGFDNQKTCLQCDNTKCATCQNLDTQCILNCNISCETCTTNSFCNSCKEGFYLFGPESQKTCLQCDNTKCATCINQDSQCVINCNSTCQTCNIDSFCNDCEDGFYLFGADNQKTCLQCNNTICATCINQDTQCVINCNSTCQTCNIYSFCSTCEDGFYLFGADNQKTCLQCDNTKCATCQNLDTQCILNCNSTCKTCITNSYCDSCESGFFLFGPDNQKTCLQCDNTKCATCISQDSKCIINCNSTCQACNIDSFCNSCYDQMYLSDQVQKVCLKCNEFKCATCVNKATECILHCNNECQSCASNQQCKSCFDGMFLSGESNITCLHCNNTLCATCINKESECVKKCNPECLICTPNAQCESCQDGKFLLQQNGVFTCLQCDIHLCATCIDNSQKCILDCNSECLTCKVNQQCLSCNIGLYLYEGDISTCLLCDNKKCATCVNTDQQCILECDKTCKTCKTDSYCINCEEGKYLSSGVDTICLQCDNTKCATCINQSDSCILKCNSDCLTCLPNSMCKSCQDGYYLTEGVCQQCDNKICGTCIEKNNQCIIQCHESCQTCRYDGKCISCRNDYFLEVNVLICKKNIPIIISKKGRIIYF